MDDRTTIPNHGLAGTAPRADEAGGAGGGTDTTVPDWAGPNHSYDSVRAAHGWTT
jgi:hypothetical protein